MVDPVIGCTAPLNTDAVMLMLPCAVVTAYPVWLIVAIDVSEEVQLIPTEPFRGFAEPSEKVPMAWNCWGTPSAILEFEGATLTETSTGGPTVKEADPKKDPTVAFTVVV